MSPPIRELLASIGDIEVGRLRDQGNIWSFQYSSDWLASGDAFDLAPSLPMQKATIVDGATERPVQWFFDNLLPEEQAREVLAKEAAVASSDAFGLLAYYGKESAGAITLLAPGEIQSGESGYRRLTDQALHERISLLSAFAKVSYSSQLAARLPRTFSSPIMSTPRAGRIPLRTSTSSCNLLHGSD